MKTGFIALFAVLLLSGSANARDFGEGLVNQGPSRVLDNQSGEYDHWKGIGRMSLKDAAQCTASLIDTRGGSTDVAAPAYVITSGHCTHFSNSSIGVDLEAEGSVDFNYFHDTLDHTLHYAVKKIRWSSMRGVDLALVELDVTLAALIEAGITPIPFTEAVPAPGAELLVVRVPTQQADLGLRVSACTLVKTDSIIEFPWIFRAPFKTHCQDLGPGSSGGLLLERYSNRLVGVLSTGTLGDEEKERCFINAPCEIADHQPSWQVNSMYASPALGLRHCFSQGRFAPTGEQCGLLPAFSMTYHRPWLAKHYVRASTDSDGEIRLPTWELDFTLDTAFYRYKTVHHPMACENPNHFSSAIAADNALIDAAIGPELGLHFLCIVGVSSAEQRPSTSLMHNVLVLGAQLVGPGPTRAPQMTITASGVGYGVAWEYEYPFLSRYNYKSGPVDTTDCEVLEGYERVTDDLQVPAAALPLKLCTVAYDLSRQASLPRTDILWPAIEAEAQLP